MTYTEKPLHYDRVTDPEELARFGVDPLLPPDYVVVKCVETDELHRICTSEEEFAARYEDAE